MKRLILFALLLINTLGATRLFAQSTLMATLSHEGNVTTYNGTNAFSNAMNDAVDGDVITLSPGTFSATDITKAVTIRGAGGGCDGGWNEEAWNHTTTINGGIDIRTSNAIVVEDVYFNNTLYYDYTDITNSNSKFIRCRISKVYYHNWSGKIIDAQFINCYITGEVYCKTGSNMSFTNCIVRYPHNNENSYMDFLNCVIRGGDWGTLSIYNSNFKNCIYINYYINDNYYASSLQSSNSASHCVFIGPNDNFFKDVSPSISNTSVTESFLLDDYQLNDAAKATYLGTDDTEIGIYGGIMPFKTTPANPHISDMKVAQKTTESGNLKVEITVKGFE